jgi:hypothetical protein
LYQEALRQSRLHLERGSRQGEASSSNNQGVFAADATYGAAVESQLVPTTQGDKSTEALPLTATQDPDRAVSTTTRTGTAVVDVEHAATATPSRQPYPFNGPGRSIYRSMPWSNPDTTEDDVGSDHTSSTASDTAPATGWTTWPEPQVASRISHQWPDAASASAPPLATDLPQASTGDYHADNAIGPDDAWADILPFIRELIVSDNRRSPARLASAIRKQMLHLIETTWSPTLQAFSLVTLDPLASLIAQSPQLDFWVNVAVPHIRVQLPRSINSLAIFKGSAEHARDRAGPYVRPARAAEINNDADPHATSLRDQYPQPQVVEPIVGGDGSGGGLVHPHTRLFEVEVNTIREMMDDMWNQAGAELPPQVCRILTGTQDWSEVGLRKQFLFSHYLILIFRCQCRKSSRRSWIPITKDRRLRIPPILRV